jgi:hypothetical protein
MKEINMSDNGQIEEVEKKVKEPTKDKPQESKEAPANKKEKTEKKNKDLKKTKQNTETTKKEKKVETPEGSIEKKKAIIILSGIGLLFLLGLAAFYYFGIYKYNPKAKDENIVRIKDNYVLAQTERTNFSKLLVDTPQEPRTEESPLNGLLFTKDEFAELKTKRPVAVMINNHADSRPQSGLSSADLVYETLAEGGITRHMAFFWSQGPSKVGSIRSARQYFLEWLSPYDPLYIHIGWADTDNPRTDARGNIIAYNIKDVGITGYWQWVDSGRVAPHDKYNSVQFAWDYSETRGWDGFPTNLESWKFKNDEDADKRGDGYRYEIKFHNFYQNYGLYDSIWEYNPSTNSYKRWVGGQPHIDQETNTQITAKVVVVQETEMRSAGDSKGRIIVDTIGEGDAVILMDGKEIEGTWKKTDRMDRTTFYDENGKEIEFNRGRIWISVISQSWGKFDIIEQ